MDSNEAAGILPLNAGRLLVETIALIYNTGAEICNGSDQLALDMLRFIFMKIFYN